MITTKWLGIVAAAFVAGSFIASPELRAYAANTVFSTDIVDGQVKTADLAGGAVTNAKLGSNAVNSAKIASGGVANSDIAPNAVTSGKIADSTIVYGDLSRNLVAVEHRADCNCGGTGWDPDGTLTLETIFDDRITLNSVISVTVSGSGLALCTTEIPFSGAVGVICNKNISQGATVSYAIFNNPAYD